MFHQPLTRPVELALEKVAFDIKLEREADDWASEVISQAYKTMPFLKSYEMDAEFDRVDSSRGYALGKLFVYPTGIEKDAAIKDRNLVVFPLIVRQENLSPFDVFSHNGQLRPMTKEAVEKALFRPGMFGSPARKGDLSGGGMTSQMSPPTTSTNRYRGGGFAKGASVLDKVAATIRESTKNAFMQKIANDPGLRATYLAPGPIREAALVIAGSKEKTAATIRAARRGALRADVIQIVEDGVDYLVKQANSKCFRPVTSRRSALEIRDMLSKEKLASLHASGSLVITFDPVTDGGSLQKKAQAASVPGIYEVTSGGRVMQGVVVPHVVTLDGDVLPVGLFANERVHSMQKVAGVHLRDLTIPACDVRGVGAFVHQNGVSALATEPLEITNEVTTRSGNEKVASYLGRRLISGEEVKITPTAGLSAIYKLAEAHYAVPVGMAFLPLPGRGVTLQDNPGDVDAVLKIKTASASEVTVVGDGLSFSFRGAAAPFTETYNRVEAAFALGAFGVHGDHVDSILNKTASLGMVKIPRTRKLHLEWEIKDRLVKQAAANLPDVSGLSPELITEVAALANAGDRLQEYADSATELWYTKTASVVIDRETTDAVLSLQFLTPENVTAYVEAIPQLEKSANKLAEIVVASRLGMDDVRESAATKAMRSVSDVINGLSSLRHKVA
jgi:hypothetical protein